MVLSMIESSIGIRMDKLFPWLMYQSTRKMYTPQKEQKRTGCILRMGEESCRIMDII